jgi:hypothetical protein
MSAQHSSGVIASYHLLHSILLRNSARACHRWTESARPDNECMLGFQVSASLSTEALLCLILAQEAT